jgi:hypothetical protein
MRGTRRKRMNIVEEEEERMAEMRIYRREENKAPMVPL